MLRGVRLLSAAADGGFSQAIEEHPDQRVDAEKWLCGIAILDLDLPAILERWLAARSMNATLQLAFFLMGDCLFEAEPIERGYWNLVDMPAVLSVRRWLLSDRIFQRLSSARGWAAPSDEWLIDKALAAQAGRRQEALQ